MEDFLSSLVAPQWGPGVGGDRKREGASVTKLRPEVQDANGWGTRFSRSPQQSSYC